MARKRRPGELKYSSERQEVAVAERQTEWLGGQLQLGVVYVCVCVSSWWPAATRLHVHCPTAGVEVRREGLSGKWPQWGATRLVEHSSSE